MGGDDQALFRESDNLESLYAKAALRRFYIALWRGNIPGWSLDRFEDATGLKLVHEGNLKEDLPPMPRFLNRLLARPIDEQNQLFAELEERIAANIEQAMEAGAYEVGVETVRADSLAVAGRETLYEHPGTGAVTELVEIIRRDKLEPLGRRCRVRDRRPRARTRTVQAETGGQRPLEARRRPLAGGVAHVRRWRGAGARPPPPPCDPRNHGPRRARRLQLAPSRRGALAHALGTGDRGAADAPGVAFLARRRPAAARLGPAAGREHAGAPACDGYRRGADRARARRRTGRGRAHCLRPRRRPRHDRRGGLRGRDGPRLAPSPLPMAGALPAGASWAPTGSRSRGRPIPIPRS